MLNKEREGFFVVFFSFNSRELVSSTVFPGKKKISISLRPCSTCGPDKEFKTASTSTLQQGKHPVDLQLLSCSYSVRP